MMSFSAWVEDIALTGDYYLQLRAATRHSKSPVGFMEYDTVATQWKRVVRVGSQRVRLARQAPTTVPLRPRARK